MEQNVNTSVLQAAYNAWMASSQLRKSRFRCKQFTYGSQWIDSCSDANGKIISDWDRYSQNGSIPVTNNLIRQMVRTIVGRYRSQVIDSTEYISPVRKDVAIFNELNELDSRCLEEFLVSGCCIQRVDNSIEMGDTHTVVTNINPNLFFVNAMSDIRSWDCEIVGQLHDLSIAQLIQRLADGSRRKARWLRKLYTENATGRAEAFSHAVGADNISGCNFWQPLSPGKCRAIEVWTLESREVMMFHNKRTAQLSVENSNDASHHKNDPDTTHKWGVITTWHCRWFSPMGDLLAEWDSPYQHRHHPFVMKFYPLTDGEVHSFVEGLIDQQKHVNRMITMLDQIMASCAKGVLLYPASALPDGFTWNDVRKVWSSTGGILPYSAQFGDAKPEQISANATNMGGYEMVKLQMQLLEEVSGVSGAMQGKDVTSGNSAQLYKAQAENANLAMTDIYGTFSAFRHQRDSMLPA